MSAGALLPELLHANFGFLVCVFLVSPLKDYLFFSQFMIDLYGYMLFFFACIQVSGIQHRDSNTGQCGNRSEKRGICRSGLCSAVVGRPGSPGDSSAGAHVCLGIMQWWGCWVCFSGLSVSLALILPFSRLMVQPCISFHQG